LTSEIEQYAVHSLWLIGVSLWVWIIVFELKSFDIGDPSLIGLSCESGEFSDCFLDDPAESVPFGCGGVLFFSDKQSTCGCGSARKKRSDSGREGWTKFFTNTDTPKGTGDHEHYFNFIGDSNLDILKVYDSSGLEYTGCVKKAIHIRERRTHSPWWKLKNSYTLLFSENGSHYSHIWGTRTNCENCTYTYRLKPDSGWEMFKLQCPMLSTLAFSSGFIVSIITEEITEKFVPI